jgi:hypothetical protein
MRFVRFFESPSSAEHSLRLIADFQHLRAWDESVVEVEPLQEAFGLGAAYRVLVNFNGRMIPMRYEVTSYVPGHSAVLRGVAEKATAIDRIEVTPNATGCDVRYDAEIRMAFPYSLFDWLMAFGFKTTVDRAVAGLSRFLAAQHSLGDEAAEPAVGQDLSRGE